MESSVEIMAPAGSYEALQAAINAGCDSVYFGVTQLNMRAKAANNFTLDDLVRIKEICDEHGIKAYLAINTLLYEHDMRIMHRIMDTALAAKIDAVIVADYAAIEYASSIGLNIHISTQLSISNYASVKFWSRFADTIVLARELTLPMIKKITDQIKADDLRGPGGELVKIEVFAHGALCVAQSGRCGMSLYTHNSSANRGACIQNCRKPYVVIDKESGMELEIDNEYVMSPKDICTIDFLDELLASGVTVLKMEGRGRAADYVDEVIRCYREAITAIDAGEYTDDKVAAWRTRLEGVYNRGLSDGFYLGQKQGEWSKTPDSQATTEKVFVGKVAHYFPQAKVMQLEVQAHELKQGENIVITGETTGVVRASVAELRSEDDQVIDTAPKKSLVTLPLADKVRRRDKVYILRERKVPVETGG